MATYNLNAADLITLLQSTVTPTTEGAILDALIHNGDFPQANDVYNTQTNVGPALNSPPLTTQDIIIGSPTFTPILELITLPTSTDIPGAPYTTPTPGTRPVTNFNFISPGGVVIAAGDQGVSVVDFNSGTKADTLIGGTGPEKLTSLTTKSGGNSLVAGGSTVTGALGDTLQGGSGKDTLVGAGNTRLIAGDGANSLVGGTIAGAHDTLLGGAGADTLQVTMGNNRLVASNGNTLFGGSGTDTLLGASGASLVGGSGKSLVKAGTGAETLVGGSGANTLVATSASSSITASLGSGFTLFRDVIGSGPSQAGASATIIGGTGGGKVLLGNTGNDSILSGSGAINILSTQSAADLVSNTDSGATHTLTFTNHQTIVINDVNADITIHFNGGGSTNV